MKEQVNKDFWNDTSPLPKYPYKTSVLILEGFYKNYVGVIKAYEVSHEIVIYDVEVKLDTTTDKIIKLREEHVKPYRRKWFALR